MKEMQLSIYDFAGKPDYKGSMDEIVRYHEENVFENKIHLLECKCGGSPKKMFISCKDYFVECDICKCRTKYRRHMYEAMHEWNKLQI